MHKKEILKKDVTKEIKPPKVPEKTLILEELDEVYTAFDKFYEKQKKKGFGTKPPQKRLWLKPMINTMYYCGLRASEAANLTWNDVDLKGNPMDPDDLGHVRVTNSDDTTTKSGKERVIPLLKTLKPWLEQWHNDQGKPSDG